MGTLASALGPIIPALVDAPRVYADANLPAGSIAYPAKRPARLRIAN
jgi:hypothetical protein